MYSYRLEKAKKTKQTRFNIEPMHYLGLDYNSSRLHHEDKITIHAESIQELEAIADTICNALNAALVAG